MTFPQLAAQVWRIVRIGGVAALATTQGATQVQTADHKVLIVAAAVAGVEAVYRQVVPAKEQTLLEKYWAAIKTVATSPAVKAVVASDYPAIQKVEATVGPEATDLAKLAAAGIAEANENSAASAAAASAAATEAIKSS